MIDATASPLPLAGLRVLDVASFIAAPVAATVMADYGADVIKVEPPGMGDPNRNMRTLSSYPQSPVNYPWEMDSRGKRSIVIDLRTEAGQNVLYRLIKTADVLITNYPLEVRGRLKVGYEHVRPHNPRLRLSSLTRICIALLASKTRVSPITPTHRIARRAWQHRSICCNAWTARE